MLASVLIWHMAYGNRKRRKQLEKSVLVFDIETTQVEDFAKLERVAPLCIAYEWQGVMKSFPATSVVGLLNFLFAVRDADVVVGHNILGFDLPIIERFAGDSLGGESSWEPGAEFWEDVRAKSFDTLAHLHEKHGKRYGLGKLAEWNDLGEKGIIGSDCGDLWQNGERIKVMEYCESDVALSKSLYELIKGDSSIILKY